MKVVKAGADQRRFGREIGSHLWPELQRLEREKKTQPQIVEWLAQEHGIKVSVPTLSRVMAAIRAAAPVLAETLPELEPATEEDERKILRKLARDMMDGKVDEWKQAAAGATLLLRVRAEEQKPAPGAGTTTGAPPPETWTPPTFGVKEPN